MADYLQFDDSDTIDGLKFQNSSNFSFISGALSSVSSFINPKTNPINTALGITPGSASELNPGVDYFLSNLTGLAKASRYVVTIGDTANMLAHSVTLPTRLVQTRDDNNYSTGRTYKQAYAQDIGQLTISFYSNFDGYMQSDDNLIFFDDWMAGTSPYSVIINPGDGISGNKANFFDKSSMDITIDLLDDIGNPINTWICFKAFPVSISFDEMNYASANTLLGCTVTFDIEDMVSSAQGSSTGETAVDMSSVTAALGNPYSYITNKLGSPILTTPGAFGGEFVGPPAPAGLPVNDGTPTSTDWLSDLKNDYLKTANSVSQAMGEITSGIPAPILNIGKTMAAKFVTAKIAGIPFNASAALKNAAAPQLGNVVGGLTKDPALSRALNQQTQNIVRGMPKAVTAYAKQSAISQINKIISSVPVSK